MAEQGKSAVAASDVAAENRRLRGELDDIGMVFEYIMESSLAGWWDWRIQDETEYLSPSFKKLFGYADHEMENAPEAWQKIIFEEDLPLVLEVFDKHIASKGAVPYDNKVRYHHKDGRTVWVFCRGKVIEWDGDKPVRMVGNHVDITDLVKTEEALARKNDELEQANRRLDEASQRLAQSNADLEGYAYAASHDLHSPLRHVSGFLDLMAAAGTLNREQEEFYKKAKLSLRGMQELLDDLLAFSRAGNLGDRLEDVDLTAICRDMVARHGVGGAEIGALGTTRGNANLLRQVFDNLVSNAVRYRAQRPLVLKITREGEVITVRDNGLGFDDEAAHKIFEVFARGDQDMPGTGIGLAICRRVVEAHGGRIWAEGEPGEGARFMIDLGDGEGTAEKGSAD